jgi:hypothetical protein
MTEGIALDCHLFGDVLPVNALERAIVDDGQQQVFIRLVVPQGGARARHFGWMGGERCWMKGELIRWEWRVARGAVDDDRKWMGRR